jgi:hypothetical protein
MFRFHPVTIPLLVLLGLLLRLVGVDARPLDGDEGVILLAADGPVSALLERVARDVHPPLFHLLTSLALAVGGVSAFTLRLTSVVAGTVLVALGPRLARSLGANEWLVTALLATSPYLVSLSQDARMYSLLTLLTLTSWLTLTDLWREPDHWRTWVFWGFLGALLVLTHHLGWLVLAVELATTFVFRPALFQRTGHWLGAVSLIAVASLPQLPTIVHQVTGRLAEQTVTVSLIDRFVALVGAAYRFTAGRTFLDLAPARLLELVATPLVGAAFLVTLAPLALHGLGKLSLVTDRRREPASLGWFGLVSVSLLAALAISSIADQAVRYLAFLAPVTLGFVALGVERSWRSWWGTLLGVALIGTTTAGLWTQFMVHNRAPGLDAYAASITASETANDIILIRGSFAGGELAAFQQVYRGPTPIVDLYQGYSVGTLAALRAVQPADQISALLSQYRRVWFYDQTYAPNPLVGLDPVDRVTVQILGYDKEQQPLRLYRIDRAMSHEQ